MKLNCIVLKYTLLLVLINSFAQYTTVNNLYNKETKIKSITDIKTSLRYGSKFYLSV